jgi:hypothetical protein
MLTTGSKFMFGSAVLALVGAFFVAIATVGQNIGMDELTGPITIGYKGAVGNHFAYAVLLAYAAVAILIGAVLSVTRDGDPDVGARYQGLSAPVAVLPPRGTNHWTLVGAFGAGMVVLGLAYNPALFVLGLVTAGISAMQWAIYAWSDHATADPFANRRVRHELTYPLDFPLFAILSIALFVFAVSRVLLAFPHGVDTAVFGAIPAVAFVVAIILSQRPKVSHNLIAALTVVGAAIVLTLGIWGMVQGPKHVEKDENTPHLYDIRGASHGAAGAPISVQVTGKEN